MSSLTHEQGSRTGYRLRAYTAAGRRSIWLGEIPERDAITIQRHVDEIIASQTADMPLPRQTVQWLDRAPANLRAKLQAILGASRTVRDCIDAYLTDRRESFASSTMEDRGRSLDILADAVGDRAIERITIDEIAGAHAAIPSGASTRGKIASAWKAFFAWCVDRKWILDNPARHLSTHVAVRQKQFIPRERIDDILNITEDPELCVAICLSRFCGIRMSSELRTMTWDDIDFDRRRITIHDTKRGCDRIIPLFPELVVELRRHPRDVPLCGNLIALSHAAISARFTAAIIAAGHTPWPALWHAMRASRETELIQRFGVATASLWVGNSESVALRSYAVVTNDQWQQATEPHL